MRTTDTKSRPQRVNSYRLSLFLTNTALIRCRPESQPRPQGAFPWLWRWGAPPPKQGKSALETRLPESRSGETAQGEFRLADELCKVTSRAQSLCIKQRLAKGVQRNITNFFKAWITTDSIKIFSITFCTLVTVYCTYKIVNCALRYNFLHAALRCCRYRLLLYLLCSGYVQCCMLQNDSVFVLWINNWNAV